MTAVVLFDVNETLLDLRALRPFFQRVFGDENVLSDWFSGLLRAAMALTLTGEYRDFGELAATVSEAQALRVGVRFTEAHRQELGNALRGLPPHPDAVPALGSLREAGFHLATLTNSSPVTAEAQLRSAGLDDYFERILSVDAVRRFKPAPEPYLMALKAMAAEAGTTWMVAAHDWDVAGAMAVGLRGALIVRGSGGANPSYPQPEIVATDLILAARRMIAAASGRGSG